MELKDYTTEELKAEIKRRWKLEQEEKKKIPRCRNCTHCKQHPSGLKMYFCDTRTWGKKIVRNYCVNLSDKACDLFENKYKKE